MNKNYLEIALVFLLIGILGTTGLFIWALDTSGWIQRGDAASWSLTNKECSYLIFLSGSTYLMQNGTTGYIDYSSTNVTLVEQYANGNLTSGGTIYLKGLQWNTSLTISANILVIEEYQGKINYYTENNINTGAQPYSYEVGVSGSNYYAKNGTTSQVDYQSPSAATAIQYCINTGMGNTIQLKGVIALTSTVYVNQSHTTIKGTSKEYQTDIQTSVAGPAFFIGFSTGSTKVEYASIQDVMIRSTSRTAGRNGVHLQGCREVTLQGIVFRNIDKNIILNTTVTALTVRGNIQLNDITMENSVGYGIYAVGGESDGTIPELESHHIRMWGEDYDTCPVSGIWAESLRGDFYNLEIDYTTSHAIYIQRPQQVKLNSLWIEYAGGYGVFYNSSASSTQSYTNGIDSISFIQNCNYSGLAWYKITDSHIESTEFRNNGKLNVTGENDAIKLYSCQRITVLGCNMFDDSTSNKNQYYALSTNGTTDYTIVIGNHVLRNLGTITYVDTHIYGAHNDGFTFPAEVVSESGVNPSNKIIVYPYDATQYAAINASTNMVIEGPSTNLSDVVNEAFEHLTSGRTWLETLELVGNVTLTSYIAVPNYTRLDMSSAHITVGNSYAPNIITAYSEDFVIMVTNADHSVGNQYVELVGGFLDGNGGGQTADTDNNYAIVWFDKVTHGKMLNVHAEDSNYGLDITRGSAPRAFCFLFTGCTEVTVSDCYGYYSGYEVVGIRGSNTNIHVTDSYFEAGKKHTMQTCVWKAGLSSNDQIDVSDCKLKNGYEAGSDAEDVYCMDGDGNTWIHNTEIEGNRAGMAGVRLINAVSNVVFEDSNLTLTGGGGSYALHFGNSGYTGTIQNVKCRNLRATSASCVVYFTTGQVYTDFDFVGCTFTSTNSHVFECDKLVTRLACQNNRLVTSNGRGFYINGTVNALFTGNYVSATAASYCFYLNNTSNSTFANNVLRTGAYGFYEELACSGNLFMGNDVSALPVPSQWFVITATDDMIGDNVGIPACQSGYTFTVSVTGSYYYAVSKHNITISTSASTVFDLTITENASVFIKDGQYQINNLLSVDVKNWHLIGSGWGTQINFGASGGFNITSTDDLYDIQFCNIYFHGQGTATQGITSEMAANKRISNLLIRNCRFDNFDATGAIAVDLENLEESHIENNYFYQTKTALLQLKSDDYDAGNIRITGNVFYFGYDQAGENAIRIVTQDRDESNGSFHGVYCFGNHFLGVTNSATAIAYNFTTVEGTITEIRFTSERFEGCRLIETASANSTWYIRDIRLTACIYWTDDNDVTAINFAEYTRDCLVEGCQFEMQGTTDIFIVDNSTSSTAYNTYKNNLFYSGSSATFTLYHHAYFTGNTGAPVSLTMTAKTNGVDNLRNGDDFCNFGASNNNVANETTYTIRNSDMYLNVSGGTVVSITITDPNGNTIANLGTSCTMIRVPHLWGVTVVYSVAPTVVLCWAQ